MFPVTEWPLTECLLYKQFAHECELTYSILREYSGGSKTECVPYSDGQLCSVFEWCWVSEQLAILVRFLNGRAFGLQMVGHFLAYVILLIKKKLFIYKTAQAKVAILNAQNVRFSNGQPFEIRTLKCSVLGWRTVFRVRIVSPHCNELSV